MVLPYQFSRNYELNGESSAEQFFLDSKEVPRVGIAVARRASCDVGFVVNSVPNHRVWPACSDTRPDHKCQFALEGQDQQSDNFQSFSSSREKGNSLSTAVVSATALSRRHRVLDYYAFRVWVAFNRQRLACVPDYYEGPRRHVAQDQSIGAAAYRTLEVVVGAAAGFNADRVEVVLGAVGQLHDVALVFGCELAHANHTLVQGLRQAGERHALPVG